MCLNFVLTRHTEKLMNTEKIESLIQSKNLTAPRVTNDFIESIVGHIAYELLPSGHATVCQITLINGYTVEAISSVMSRENYDEEVGRIRAYEKAIEKVKDAAALLITERMYQITREGEQFKQNLSRGVGMYFRHYSGVIYKLLHTVKDEEDLSEMAVYKCVADGELYTRPLDQFYEKFTCAMNMSFNDGRLITLQGQFDELMVEYSKIKKMVEKGQPEHINDCDWELLQLQLIPMREHCEILMERMSRLSEKKELDHA